MCYGIKSKCKTNSRACELVVSHFIPHSVACSQHPCFRTVSRLFSRVFSLCLTQLPLLHSIKLDTWTLTSDSSLLPPLSFKQLWLWNTGDKGIRRMEIWVILRLCLRLSHHEWPCLDSHFRSLRETASFLWPSQTPAQIHHYFFSAREVIVKITVLSANWTFFLN